MNTTENTLNKILIVDDNRTNREILEMMLEDSYGVKSVKSGEEALSEVQVFNPDIILLDIMMPGINGFEVLKVLKSKKETKNIPVLFISGNISTEFKVRAFELGGADYIVKPFEAEEVLARIETHLNLKFAREEIEKYSNELEKKLEERTEKLLASEKDAAFSLMIQGIIHNLRGPLTGVFGNSDLIIMLVETYLGKDEIDIDDLNKFLRKILKMGGNIRSSGDKLASMIDSLMLKSKTNKSDEVEKIELNSLIKTEIEFLNANTRFKHYTDKKYSFSDSKLFIDVIPSEISQIFTNLVTNSLHAMWEQKDGTIVFATGANDEFVWFSIKDNGGGIPQKIKDKIFDPFFSTKIKIESEQKEKIKTEEPTGTGLGLHSVKETVNSYNGKLELNSEEGVGTEFIIYIPKCK